jgi:hypothetical protein
MLQHGQLKAALTDRIEWVLGPDAEVNLVRRICAAYVSGLQLEEIAGLATAEGWRTTKGRTLSTQGLKNLLGNEALIGNFVWGIKSKGGKVIACSPTRMDGSVPRVIDDETWSLMQARLKSAADAQARGRATTAALAGATRQIRRPRQLQLAFPPSAADETYRRRLGTSQQLRDHAREFGRALCAAVRAAGLPAAFDTRTNVLTFWGARVRVRLMWPTDSTTWMLERSRCASEIPHVLVARMAALYRPMDFFLLPARLAGTALSQPLVQKCPGRCGHTGVRHRATSWCAFRPYPKLVQYPTGVSHEACDTRNCPPVLPQGRIRRPERRALPRSAALERDRFRGPAVFSRAKIVATSCSLQSVSNAVPGTSSPNQSSDEK